MGRPAHGGCFSKINCVASLSGQGENKDVQGHTTDNIREPLIHGTRRLVPVKNKQTTPFYESGFPWYVLLQEIMLFALKV